MKKKRRRSTRTLCPGNHARPEVFLFGEAHERCTAVAERGDECREAIASSANDGEVRLHLPATLLDADIQSGNADKDITMCVPSFRRSEMDAASSFVLGKMSQNPATTPYLLRH